MPDRLASNTIRRGLALDLILIGAFFGGGCASQSVPGRFEPEGARSAQGLPADMLPPVIDLSDQTAFVRTTITPTIIDTRTFPIQNQLTAPFSGAFKTVKHQLPKHSRDKTLAPGSTDRALPIGQAVDMDRVHPRVATGFEAISQTEWVPPDPTLAVGPNHIVATVNSAIAFYDKSGNQTFSTHLGTPGNPGFFESVGASSNFVYDPKCFYDHNSGRFIVMALEQIGTTESWIDIAISDDSDPNGIWYKYRTFSVIQIQSSTYWVDYPGFGFDDNAFYVTANLFKLAGPDVGFAWQLFRIFDKAPMLVGDPVVFTDNAPGNGASLQVAQMFGPAPRCYFINRQTASSLRVWTINDPLGTPSIAFVNVPMMAPATGPSQDAPNPGGGLISTLDGRLMNAHYRDGNLYTAHAINGPPGITVARWYHINTNGWPDSGTNPTLAQQGEITGTGGEHYYFPAIYSDRFQNVGMIMARSSATEFASVQVSGRVPSDPPGTMSTPVQLAIGDRGTDGRWGDFLDITIDPTDDTTFWIVGMYQRNFGWQTWIDTFTVAPPCPGDLNNDGVLNFFDISVFLNAFNAADPLADINNDGLFNFFDISGYIALFNQGCP